MLKEILYLVIVFLGIPVGIFLAKLCNEEINAWKFRLKMIVLIVFTLGVLMFFLNFEYKIPVIAGLGFIIATCLIIIWKK